MAVDMFLKITDIEGESQDDKHKGEMQIDTFSWGAQQGGSSAHGTGAGAGKVQINDMSIAKQYDSASPKLFFGCATGKHYAEALITVRKAGEKPLEYLKIKMSDVLIASVTHNGNNFQDTISENLMLNFSKVDIEYTPQDAKGIGGKPILASWDQKTNKAT